MQFVDIVTRVCATAVVEPDRALLGGVSSAALSTLRTSPSLAWNAIAVLRPCLEELLELPGLTGGDY